MGTEIFKHNEWAKLRADCRHYVWAVYNAAVMFKEGRGPV
jgi:hypothetical protein